MAEEAISVFLSYSHRDSEMLTELNKHLAGLRRTNKIATWHDRDIEAGDEWEPAIQEQLNAADIIILLISADFIASDYCYCKELQRAIERHDAGEARVIPVILKPCLWNDADIPLSKLNVLPDRALAITQWENSAEAYTNIAQGILSTIASVRNKKTERLDGIQKHRRQLNGSQAPVNDLSCETVVDNPATFQEGKKSLHKIEIFILFHIIKLYALELEHQIKILEYQIKVFIEEIQERCRQKILGQHSQIRLLSGNEIGVDQLYVDVWLLGKPESKCFNTAESLLSNFDITQDRLALSKRMQRNPGFDIANHNPKLVILGKPGSGKTTFLKHLAIDWCKGKFQSNKIAVLIEFRRIREQDKNQKWNLIDVIGQELELKEKAISDLLERGKLLVLMDGLDEVPTDELRKNVQDQVKGVAEKYSNKNRFILTCRTQIIGIIPSGFASVEVADFNSGQIQNFVQNWFIANGKSELEAIQQWNLMQLAISSQPDLREVTATPVLLSLICVVWQDSGEIPTNRTNLYKKGISWLLRRWNDEKKIEGWEVGTKEYRKLSIKDKEALLTQIAARKFENPKNFVLFEQDELVEQISQKLKLANEQEGLSVLKAIEAQHGLLIERADELWSFSHLTFQEYFTVQWLTQLSPQQLAEKIANQQWQKAVEQLVKSQQPADWLLRLIKQAVDQLIAQEPAIQDFLDWLLHKSSSLQSNYKPAAIRAFYYLLTLSCDRALSPALVQALDLDLDLNLALTRTPSLDLSWNRNRNRDLELDLALDLDLAPLSLDRSLALALDLSIALSPALSPALDLDRLDLDRARAVALEIVRVLNLSIDHVLDLNLSPDFIEYLHQLQKDLPISTRSNESRQWWPLLEEQWSEELRQVMIKYRNIGYDWEFTHGQNQQFHLYNQANNFLVSLINIEGAVSKECRNEMEEGLLLPWTELQRRQPHLYRELRRYKKSALWFGLIAAALWPLLLFTIMRLFI